MLCMDGEQRNIATAHFPPLLQHKPALFPFLKGIIKEKQEVIMSKENFPTDFGRAQFPGNDWWGIRLNDLQFSPDGETWYGRSRKMSKTSLFAWRDGEAAWDLTGELNPSGAVAYGGGDFYAGKSAVYFCERNGRLYSKTYGSGLPKVLTPAFGGTSSPVPSPDESFWFSSTLTKGAMFWRLSRVTALPGPQFWHKAQIFTCNLPSARTAKCLPGSNGIIPICLGTARA